MRCAWVGVLHTGAWRNVGQQARPTIKWLTVETVRTVKTVSSVPQRGRGPGGEE